MRVSIQLYNDILQKVTFFYKQLQLRTHEKTTGRTLAISIIETISLAIFKQVNNIATKIIHLEDIQSCLFLQNPGGESESSRNLCTAYPDGDLEMESKT